LCHKRDKKKFAIKNEEKTEQKFIIIIELANIRFVGSVQTRKRKPENDFCLIEK
jgi:hypothetical protein